MTELNMPKICGVATKAFGVKWFMLDNLKYAREHGFEPYIVCEKTDIFSEEELKGIKYIPLDMQRGYVSPLEVIKSVKRLYKILRREKIDIVQYNSSNASLNCCIAAWLAHVPVRVYCQWGMSYSTYTGFKRFFYRTIEKFVCLFSTDVQPDSFANLEYAKKDKLYNPKKGYVIGKGSANGVDMDKFDIGCKEPWREEIREKHSIDKRSLVFGFVGRLVPDKGVNELFSAFLKLNNPRCKLVVVGPYYEVEKLDQEVYKQAQNNPNVVFVGNVPNPAKYYASMDYLVLPSYREGFGSVVIEAAAMGVPTICSRIKGPTDFVKDNVNGFICEVKSVDSLYDTMKKACTLGQEEYEHISQRAFSDVAKDFEAKVFRKLFVENRKELYLKRKK